MCFQPRHMARDQPAPGTEFLPSLKPQPTGGPMFSNLTAWRATSQPAIQIAAPAPKPGRGGGGGPNPAGREQQQHDFGVAHLFSQLMDGNVAL